jgi:hypothetical protein
LPERGLAFTGTREFERQAGGDGRLPFFLFSVALSVRAGAKDQSNLRRGQRPLVESQFIDIALEVDILACGIVGFSWWDGCSRLRLPLTTWYGFGTWSRQMLKGRHEEYCVYSRREGTRKHVCPQKSD